MSADNYAVCPRCKDIGTKTYQERVREVKAQYGKVSADEYARLTATLPARGSKEHTFAESYEFYGVEDGTLKIRYGGKCQACNLELNLEIDVPLYVDGHVHKTGFSVRKDVGP